jgi:lysophospholipase L1-like esterase
VEAVHTEPSPTTSETDTGDLATTPETDTEASTTTAPKTAEATTEKAPAVAGAPAAPVGRVSAIGDSVMIGAAGELNRVLDNPTIDADVGLQAAGAIEIIGRRRAAGELGDVVVIHMGSNGTFTAEQFDEMMRELEGVRKVVFVNVKVPRTWEQPNNAMLAEKVRQYPNAVLADWYATSINHPEFFVEDGIHLQIEGQRAYADLIAARVKG